MMQNISPGQEAVLEVEVTTDLTTNRMGKEGADVLSTPHLLGLMENASIKATDPTPARRLHQRRIRRGRPPSHRPHQRRPDSPRPLRPHRNRPQPPHLRNRSLRGRQSDRQSRPQARRHPHILTPSQFIMVSKSPFPLDGLTRVCKCAHLP